MHLKSRHLLSRIVARISGNISLRNLLVIPFAIQIFSTVGIVGYLSFKNGQKAVDDLARQLMREVAMRIEANLESYLDIPFLVGRDIQDAVALGLLEIENLDGWEEYLWRKAEFFESISIISLANQEGEYRSTARTKTGKLQVGIAGKATNFDLYRYDSLAAFEGGVPDAIDPNYDPRQRPWYRVAIADGQAVWSKIYTRFESPPILQISASQPLYAPDNSADPEGVMSIVIGLSHISQFLRDFQIGKTGQAFIIDPEGLLVATSTSEPLFLEKNDRIIRQIALQSEDVLTREISEYLKEKFGRFDRIENPRQLKIPVRSQMHYVKLLPFEDERGLEWTIAVVIPEADFMEQIQINTRITVALCLIALGVAIAIGWVTGGWITRPVADLGQAAAALSAGDWDRKVGRSCTRELQTLARAFNQMRGQLRRSYHQLQDYSHSLEEKVAERTRELEQKVEIAEAAVRERRQAEIALRDSEQKFSTAFHSAPHPITLSRFRDGIHLEVNESFCRVTGYEVRDIIGRTVVEINLWVHPEQRSQMLEIMARDRKIRNFELEFRTKSGEIRTGLLSADLIHLNGEECLLTSSNDITERRRAEVALRRQFERERLLRQITEELRSSLDSRHIFQIAANRIGQTFAVDRCTIYTYLSSPEPQIEAVAEYLQPGYPPMLNLQHPLGDHPYTRRVLSRDVAIATEDIRTEPLLEGAIDFCNYFQIKSLLTIRTSYRGKPNGAIYLSQCRRVRTWSDEEIDLLESVAAKMGIALAQARLLEREKQQSLKLAAQNVALEEARRAADTANRAKSTFLANMSHELRTPLNAILGFSQIMAHNPAFAAGSQELEIINRSGEHLLELINDILDLSKIEAGKITVERHPFDLHRLLDTLEELFKLRAKSRGIWLRCDWAKPTGKADRAPDLPRYILGDEKKLRQVLINLLGNAVKFTADGGVTLRADFRAGIPGSNAVMLEFAVEDTGPGIAPEEIETLFDAFVQTDMGRDAQQGTGLGLSISHKFVELMGGEIRVSSQVGRGSRFGFEIPADLATGEAIAVSSVPRRPIAIASEGETEYRVLVVDEVPENRLLVRCLLKPLGFRVFEAENGLEAIRVWERHAPQLIWMDMRMPVMDGYEATRQIRSHPSGEGVKIIALTASALQEQEDDIRRAGCDDILRKPFQAIALFEKMAVHLGIRYRYAAETPSPTVSPAIARTLTPAALQVMPPDWLRRLYEAAIRGDDARVLELIAEIPASEAELAAILTQLVDDFRLDTIDDIVKTLI
ncbi:MAG: ATP-binding protein [Limnospira sp.]